MAPYTMTITVENKTNLVLVSAVGKSTMKSLDGSTWADVQGAYLNSTSVSKVSKSGGTDGLFTACTWAMTPAGSNDPMMHPAFSLWCRMYAGKDEIDIQLADVSGTSPEQYQSSSWADYCYGHPTGPRFRDSCEFYNSVKVQISEVKKSYPDSSCKITVTPK